MSLFFPQPRFCPDDDDLMTLVETIQIHLPVSGKDLLIKAGYRFNGFSIPQIFWSTGLYPYKPSLIRGGLAPAQSASSRPGRRPVDPPTA